MAHQMSATERDMGDAEFPIDHVFEGGDMDCGSGLILLIRQAMLEVPEGGILELRSSEPTVSVELPPWCRMVGHVHVGTKESAPGKWVHWVRRGAGQASEVKALEDDKQRALSYQWRLRARHSANLEATVFARNFSWKLGQPASFEESDAQPSALEAALGALLADVINGFASRCRLQAFIIDELEGSVTAGLHNVLAHMGLEDGDPSMKSISITAFITSPVPGDALRDVWSETLRRSPLYCTFSAACSVDARLVIL